jgi:calcium-translocating P-type ATPase
MNKKFSGLNDSQVKENQNKYGSNKLPEQKLETFWEKFKGNLDDPMLKLLIAIAGIMIVMFFFGQAEIYEPIGTIIAIVLVAGISAKTEMASDKEYQKLKNSTKKDQCKVYRNGLVTVVDIDDIVVGDIVILQSGDKIPADGVLIQGELKVDNSALNGETEECKKFATDDENFNIPDNITGDTFVDKHSLFRGAVVYDGEGLMEVKRVGIGNPETGYPGTMMGKMAEEMNEEEVPSPLKVKLAKLANQISTFGYIGAIVLAIAYLAHFMIVAGGPANYLALGWMQILKDFLEAAELAIIVVVCAVPEGLPLMISIVLMSNTGEMLKHNVLVRKPIGIETAGSLNILFSDKTGTITKGKLEVVEFFDGNAKTYTLDNMPSNIKGSLDLSICKNTAAMFDTEHHVVGGNMTDKALLEYLSEDTFNKLSNDKDCVATKFQAFNSANKFSQSYIPSASKTFYKGAPERLLAKAKKCLDDKGNVVDLDIKVVNNKIDELADKAMRVLAFGYSNKELVDNEINDDVVIIGFVGIRDDVRPEAVTAIKDVQDAGIQVVMITGDRKETAVAIAKDAGLLRNDDELALTSDELNKMSDDEVKKILPKLRVIARALPTDKSRMVRLAQELNLVCGMTGDGVNDSPALKKADVGFAMGISGTDAAKQAAEIILTDDNFQSIRNAVLYGRTIYLNILKFCRFQLTINVAAVLVSAILPFLGFEAPLGVCQMLFLNLVMDSLGALLLGKEPARESYMKHEPKKRDENIITKNIFIQFVSMGIFVTILSILWFEVPWFESFFGSNEQFRTGYFAFFIFASIFNGFNVRTDGFGIFKDLDKNPSFMKVWSMMLLATVILCLIGGPIGKMFGCTRFGIKGWVLVVLYAITIIPVDLLRKAIFKTYKNE